MALFLEEKLESWQVFDKVDVIISDSAANMLKLMDFLPEDDSCQLPESYPQFGGQR